MVGQTGEGTLAQISCERWSIGRRVVRIEQLDGLVGRARKQLPIGCPAHILDNILMGVCVPDLALGRQIPDLDHSITTATGETFQRAWVFGHGIDTVHVAITNLS